MNFNHTCLTNLMPYSKADIQTLIDLAIRLKSDKQNHTEKQNLVGKQFCLIFEKASTRTRCAAEVAARDQGAFVTYIGPNDSHIGHKESIKDTAKVLSHYYDGILYRGFDHSIVETLATHATVPVWNGLTQQFHPTQVLADLMTMRELVDCPFEDMKLAYLGDASQNMGNSLLLAMHKMGVEFRIAPSHYVPDQSVLSACANNVLITDDLATAVNHCDFLYTDVWVSMGENDASWKQKIKQLLPYQINTQTLALTNNPACHVLHCLPAFHDLETTVGQQIASEYGLSALEISDEIFQAQEKTLLQQAENRMHLLKAIMIATMGAR